MPANRASRRRATHRPALPALRRQIRASGGGSARGRTRYEARRPFSIPLSRHLVDRPGMSRPFLSQRLLLRYTHVNYHFSRSAFGACLQWAIALQMPFAIPLQFMLQKLIKRNNRCKRIRSQCRFEEPPRIILFTIPRDAHATWTKCINSCNLWLMRHE